MNLIDKIYKAKYKHSMHNSVVQAQIIKEILKLALKINPNQNVTNSMEFNTGFRAV